MKKGVPIEAVPVPDEDYFDSIRPDDPNNKWHMEYCYWEAKPNPAETNEGIPQKLMIKSFPEDYYTTGSKDYNPAGELEETAEGTEEIVGNLTGNATLDTAADELVGNLTENATQSEQTELPGNAMELSLDLNSPQAFNTSSFAFTLAMDDELGAVVKYEKSANGPLVNQSIGELIPSEMIAGRDFDTVSAGLKIKFDGDVPPKADNFGLEINGQIFNDWLDDVQPFKWYTVSEQGALDASGTKTQLVLDGMANNTPVLLDFSTTVYNST